MEIRFGRVVTCDGSLCRAVGQQARWAWRFEKSGLGAGLTLRDRDSIQRHAGRGFTHNPMGYFCRLFNCTLFTLYLPLFNIIYIIGKLELAIGG